MGYFSKLRERRSSFYNRLWDELEGAKVIDTHDHLAPPDTWKDVIAKTGTMLPHVFEGSYLYHFPAKKGAFKAWMEQISGYKFTTFTSLVAML
nr:hypothetical protein [Candidatus Sigynarchaeota archaeon]